MILFLLLLVIKTEAKSNLPNESVNVQGDNKSSVKQKELYNLYELAKKAEAKNLPIVLTFVAEWCEFCHILGSEVLDPMALSGVYDENYMFMRYVSIDDPKPIKGFDNKLMIKDKFADKYNADLTPTMIFIDSTGKQVADPIVGIAAIELYSMLIHKALNQAYKNMNKPLKIPSTVEELFKVHPLLMDTLKE